MNLDLPPTDTQQPPQFADLAQCRTWQAALPLSNPVQAQAQLLRQLHLLNRYTLTGEVRLAMLELLRESIQFVQEESAKKFSGKPLPLAPPEQAAFDTAHALWQAQGTGYWRCLETCRAGDAVRPPPPQLALIIQRGLAALADDHVDLLRGGLQPVVGHWQAVHRFYAVAEDLGVATEVIADELRGTPTVTTTAAYAENILLAAASLHELNLRQQSWGVRWARRWAGKLRITATPPTIELRALPLCVDLDSDTPVGYKPFSGKGARFLDTAALRKSIKGRIELLARGGPDDTPARLGLGEDCVQPACAEVLRRLYPRWIKGGLQRRHERQPQAGGGCRFVVGVDAIHYYVSGRASFRTPGPTKSDDLRRQREEMAVFGRVTDRFMDEYSRNQGYQLENWAVEEDWRLHDQSSGGLRLLRPLKQSGGRLAVGQLVAVQLPGASGLTLGMVRWAQVRGEALAAGIQLFPGKPWPVATRGTGVMAGKENYRPGFILPAVPALELPLTFILPPGSFKPDRILEAWAPEGAQELKLKALLDRGADFERAACEEVIRKK